MKHDQQQTIGVARSNTGYAGITRTTKDGHEVFQATWYEDGRQRRTTISIARHGEAEALAMARQIRARGEWACARIKHRRRRRGSAQLQARAIIAAAAANTRQAPRGLARSSFQRGADSRHSTGRHHGSRQRTQWRL